jgi:DnaJ-class molecular chaperone
METCDTCNGTGKCSDCNGTGKQFVVQTPGVSKAKPPNDQVCLPCAGSGKCSSCQGSGTVEQEYGGEG